MPLEDSRTTYEFVVAFCDGFVEADECDKGNMFFRGNVSLFREFNTPKEWFVDLEKHGVILRHEANEFGDWPVGKYRFAAMMSVIKARNMWPKMPLLIELIKPYHAEVAAVMKDRYDELCKLVR